MRLTRIIMLVALILITVTGCGSSKILVDDQLKPLLQKGVYINSFDSASGWDGFASVTVYSVADESKQTKELQEIHIGENINTIEKNRKGLGYSILVTKEVINNSITKPELSLVSSTMEPVSFMQRLLPINEKRTDVIIYKVKLSLPKSYELPNKFKPYFALNN